MPPVMYRRTIPVTEGEDQMQQTIAEPRGRNPLSAKSSSADSKTADRLDEIYRAHGSELWASFYALCHDRERAFDAVQEAFLRLQQQPDLTSIRYPRSWLQHVGRNWIRDAARKKKRAAVSNGYLNEIPDSKESVCQTLARSESNETVRLALAKLNELDRLALSLRYGMKWPATRIAETMETTAQAIDMRLCRARTRLRNILLEMQPDFAA